MSVTRDMWKEKNNITEINVITNNSSCVREKRYVKGKE